MKKDYFTLQDDFVAIIKSQVPDCVNIEKIPTGWTNYVFRANCADGSALVFRFPRNNFFAEALKKEIVFTPYVKKLLTVNTIDITYKFHDGRGYSIHNFINGYTLTESCLLMNEQQIKVFCDDIANYINQLRQVDVTKVPDLRQETLSQFLIDLATVNNDPDYDLGLFNPLIQQEQKQLVTTHGDFNPGNIILDKDYKLVAVLDYAFICRSAPLADLSVLLARVPAKFHTPLITSYQNVTKQKVDKHELGQLVQIRKEVELDYIKYMLREHPDVKLPQA